MAEAPLWEQSKENAAPLERGRNVAVLERSLAAVSSDEERREQERMIRHYERLVHPTEAETNAEQQPSDDDDPLVHWLSYIKFHQEAFPSDTHAQFLLLERCFRAMCQVRKYANDQRFIRICCMYAEKTKRSPEIFNYLYGQKIGVNVAIFWAAWAFVAEKEGNFAFAEKIFDKGIRKKAQPVKYLLQRQKQFQRRMSRHWLNSSTQPEDDDEEESDSVRQRGVLGGLSEDSIRRNARSRSANVLGRVTVPRRGMSVPNTSTFVDRTASHRSSRSSNSNAGNQSSGFAIFTDDSTETGFPLDSSVASRHGRVLDREQDRLKENQRDTERWNERGALSNTATYGVSAAAVSRPQTPAAFAVYVDEELAAQHQREEIERQRQADQHRRLRDERTFREREDGGMAEKLTNDPLFYVRNPDRFQTDQADEHSQKSIQQPLSANGRFTAKKCSDSRGFDNRLLKSASGHEQCFEEARLQAGFFTTAPSSSDFNHMNDDDSYMSLDADGSLDTGSMGDITQQSYTSDRKRNAAEISVNNVSIASSTADENSASGVPRRRDEQTINTQLALRELSMMFSSPAFALTEEGRHLNRSGGLGPILNESGVSEAAVTENNAPEEEQAHDRGTGLMIDIDPNGSFAAVPDENIGPRNPHPRSTSTPGFESMALRTLEDRPSDGRTSCSSQRQAIGAIAQDNPLQSLHQTALNPDAGFQIYNDSSFENESPALQTETSTQNSNSEDPHAESRPASNSRFEIYQETQDGTNETVVDQSPNAVGGDGHTATLSEYNDFLQALTEVNESPDESDSSESPSLDRDENQNLEVNSALIRCQSESDASDNCLFGEESQVAYLDDDTQTFHFVGDIAPNYNGIHSCDVKSAVQRLKNVASCHLPPTRNLSNILSQKGRIFELPTHTLPRPLKRALDLRGVTVKIGRSSALVKQELGRGAYGVVVLLESGGSEDIAVKAQFPMGCLAHEFEIMRKIEERLYKSDRDCVQRFPRALSLLSLADGALLSMTAASGSGLNLIDLANVYTKVGERVPEVIALYYTSRMLKHIETLHWKTKILHCDVKPDNFVLTSKAGEPIEGSDIMLIDFGRAIDLTLIEYPASGEQSILYTKLKGTACSKDMMCVAMRKGLPWSFDIDTFGVCAAAHVLLFGSHLQVAINRNKRWMPREKIKRSCQVDLWTDFFGTLLNLDEVTKSAIGSYPHSLRQLRNRFEDCLDGQQESLTAALMHQAAILESNR